MTVRRLLPLALVATAAGGCNCGTRLTNVSDAQIVIVAPADGSTAQPTTTFEAKATNGGGLQWVSLQVGTDEIGNCTPSADDDTVIDCKKDFQLSAEQAQQVNGALTLTAVAKDSSDEEVKASVNVLMPGLTCKFAVPKPSGTPPVAAVHGTSSLEVDVNSLVDVNAVAVTVDTGDQPIVQWRPGAGSAALAQPLQEKQNVNWAEQVGSGQHTLKAICQDANGNQATDTLTVDVSCATDNDCGTGTRCCPTSGKCDPIVGPGADCDCDHPCPVNQGCFPGTCGELPRKCRPGCDPGTYDPYPGTPAGTCANEQQGSSSVPAYCSQLPADEATNSNKGGACAPADNCSVTSQNCPDAPIDRNSPASASNPSVPYTCLPSSPNTNVCYPAGNIPEHGQCQDSCDDVSQSCAKGLVCTTPVDGNGNVLGPATCEKQCTQPSDLFPNQAECPRGEYCGELLGPGFVPYATGVCSSGS